jgi:hypothetical protein
VGCSSRSSNLPAAAAKSTFNRTVPEHTRVMMMMMMMMMPAVVVLLLLLMLLLVAVVVTLAPELDDVLH